MHEELIAQLRRDEGERLSVYFDTLGFATIGIGRMVDARRGGGITREESTYLLMNDINKIDRQLQERLPWVVTLTPERRGVLMNMAFQLGIDGLMSFKRTLAFVQQGEYAKAAEAMLASKWATQTPDRAKRLTQQLLSSAWA